MANPALNGSRQGAMNMISAKLVSSPALVWLYILTTCRAVNMLATLKMIRDKFGGPEGYMITQCELSKEDIGKIRTNLIVEVPPLYERPVMIEKGRV